ncbi:MAG: hypothetical protein KatS3mg111_2756 [Pirellulaceae bacterium]|nr:MAG: hypothetical protein KatS3mg111_2756 [Pirellulaceae bacterium]
MCHQKRRVARCWKPAEGWKVGRSQRTPRSDHPASSKTGYSMISERETGERNVESWRWDLIVGGLGLLGLFPLVMLQAQRLWLVPERRFAFATWVIVGLWAIRGLRSDITRDPLRWRLGTLLLMLAAAAAGHASWHVEIGWAHVGLVLWLAGWAVVRIGGVGLPRVMGWTALLATTVPVPAVDAWLPRAIHRSAAWATASTLDAFHLPVFRIAEVVEIPGLQIVVGDACASYGSVLSLASLLVLLALWQHRSLVVTVLSVLAAPIWVGVSEHLIVLSIALLWHFGGRNALDGVDHQLLLIAGWIMAVGCAWATQVFLARMLRPTLDSESQFGQVFWFWNTLFHWPLRDRLVEPDSDDDEEWAAYKEALRAREAQRRRFQLVTWRDLHYWRFGAPVAVAGLLLAGLAPGWAIWQNGGLEFGVPEFSSSLQSFPAEPDLPAKVGGVERLASRAQTVSRLGGLGRYQLVWDYNWRGQMVNLKFRFPYGAWPDPRREFSRLGFDTIESIVRRGKRVETDGESLESASPGDESNLPALAAWPWQEFQMKNDLGGRFFLFAAGLDARFEPYRDLAGPGSDVEADLVSWWQAYRQTHVLRPWVYQLMLTVDSGEPLSDAQREELREVFLHLRHAFYQAMHQPRVVADENAPSP